MPDARKITEPLAGLAGCFVAGGAVTSLYTNKTINDFDIYPKSEEALIEAIRWAYENSGYWCVDHSGRAMTFANGNKGENQQIQIMHFDTFETAEKIFDAFDFTVCMGAYDLDEKKFVLHDMFLEHCSQRFLSFNKGTRFPYASARRVKKYEDRGYTIGMIEFQKIMLACASSPITSWDDLREQIGGVYGEAIVIPEDEDFSQDSMWKALETLKFVGPKGGFDSVEEAILSISSKPIKCYKIKDQIYADLYSDGSYERIKAEPKNPVWVSFMQSTGGLFYKKVNLKDGKYLAPHYPKFEYVVGEIAESKSGPGLFVYSSEASARGHYSGEVVIELKIDDESQIAEIRDSNGHTVLKKALVTRVVEKEKK